MQETIVEVINPKGIHARPSGLLAQAAHNYESTIILELNGIKTDAGNIMGILSLGAVHGSRIRVTADGSDEAEALEEIKRIFSKEYDD